MIDKGTPAVCITLVHGTWGRGFFSGRRSPDQAKRNPRWFEDGSRFRTRLSSRLDTHEIRHEIQDLRMVRRKLNR